jgi:Flp pilus assembly pilin Flp
MLRLFGFRARGQGVVEYGLVTALVALAVLIGANQLSGAEKAYFTGIAPSLAPASPTFATIGAPTSLVVLPTTGVTGPYGGTVTLSAALTVTSSGAAVSGKTIVFTLNGIQACGGTYGVTCPTTNGSGVATLNNVSLGTIAAGTYANGVAASFQGDISYGLSIASSLLIVTQVNTVTTASVAAATYGAGSVGLSATVTDATGVAVNEGSVTFTLMSGSTAVGSVTSSTVTGGAATASFNLAGLNAGIYAISANYSDTNTPTNFASSTNATQSPTPVLTLSAANTTTTAASLTATYGTSIVTLTGTVTDTTGAVINEGNVTFSVMNGSTLLGSATSSTVSAGSASASFDLAGINVGTYTINATYTDGRTPPNFNTSNNASQTPAAQLTIQTESTTTNLSSSSPPVSGIPTSTYGQNVTFLASVTPGAAAGSVSFYDGSTHLADVSISSGAASFTTFGLTSGSHTVTATYTGGLDYGASAASVAQTVSPASTTVLVATREVASNTTQSPTVTLAATVVDAATGSYVPVNQGSVTFGSSGCTSIGATIFNPSNGTASATCTLSTSVSNGQTFPITATYMPSGSGANFSTSASTAATALKVVSNGSKDTNLFVAPAFGTPGGTVTLSATLTGTNNVGVNGKVVTFSLNGVQVCGGASQPACPSTAASGTASVTVNLGSIPSGAYAGGVSARFAGDSQNNTSTGTNYLVVR